MLTLLRSAVVNWKRGGRYLHEHRLPMLDPDSGLVTSVALDADWFVAGLDNHHIYVFSKHTGSLVRTLVGHELGVLAVDLISRGGALAPSHPPLPPLETSGTTLGPSSIPESADGLYNSAPAGYQVLDPQGLDHLLPPSMRAALALDARYPPTLPTHRKESVPGLAESARSDVAGATRGWGQPGPLVVSGGCDKDVRVWDVRTGCIFQLPLLVSDSDLCDGAMLMGGQVHTLRPPRTHFNRALPQGAAQPTRWGEWLARRHPARMGCATRTNAPRPRGARGQCTLA